MNKKDLSEADICDRYITKAIDKAGWKKSQIRREYSFTAGQVIVQGKVVQRGVDKRADYLLQYQPKKPIAIVEAKLLKKDVGAGMQQALEYAEALQVPFVFSSSGDYTLFHDRSGTYDQVEQEISLDNFPSPEELWERYKQWQKLQDSDEQLLTSSFPDSESKELRYYQELAVNRTIEAIARGQKRCLLVMATGTGKTFTIFNIIWRLWKTKTVKRVLFLADRNILVDQAIVNDFRPFGEVMTKLDRRLVDRSGRINTSYEIYLGLYQAIIGKKGQDNLYEKFDKDFFDLVVIDECHRGSAAEDSNWRQVLDYFKEAIKIGLTATPKETEYVSNINYFGKPIFQYSLKQGIEDGFLAPFRKIRVELDKDLEGWTPEAGETDDEEQLIEQREYTLEEYDGTIVFDKRTQLVAEYVSQFLHSDDPMRKTIIFCQNIPHAARIRHALMRVERNRELVLRDYRYIMQITGDNKIGKAQLDNFINPKESYPVIATTSKLMTTGVDAQTCHLIVIDSHIESMTEFKQIIGRGTRLRPDYGKNFFTVIDFRGATEHFNDPDWDGPPIQDDDFGKESQLIIDGTKITIKVGDNQKPGDSSDEKTPFRISHQEFQVTKETVSYYGGSGELSPEAMKQEVRRIVIEVYQSLDHFVLRWNAAERKQSMITELRGHRIFLEALGDIVGKEYDPFDLICHVAFDRPPVSRRERVEQVRGRDGLAKYRDQSRVVLEALLEHYAEQGVESIENNTILQLPPFVAIGTPMEIIRSFGGKKQYQSAIQDLERMLYDHQET
ncbi:MAG: DEAD/DEAH box helicase family protein [Leptolyngbyaceae cyanobacterium bins.349]|nr:DEAD/DEAH box helicase family protein [Leptolyngbyaceae cyanobacterium bins.349]